MMKNRFEKTVVSLMFVALLAGANVFLDVPRKAGLSLFSKGDQCSTLFCGLNSGVPSVPRLAHADTQGEVEEALICQCGCGIVLKHCPHQNCGFAIPARKYIAELVSGGMGKDAIIDIFVKQYGQKALAAPKKEGFNLLGYILPFIALITAAFFLSKVIKSWTSKGAREEEKALEHVSEDAGTDIDKKIEEELKKLD